MLKKLLSSVMAVSMIATTLVVPAHAASFSSANKRTNYYDFNHSGDSNFVSVKNTFPDDNGGSECMKMENFSVDYTYTSGASTSDFGTYTANRAKYKGETTSTKDNIISYNWDAHAMGRDADGNIVAADLPRYVHQRFKLAWWTKGTMNTITFKIRKDGSTARDTFKLFATDPNDTYIQAADKSTASVKYNDSHFMLSTDENHTSSTKNTIDLIIALNPNGINSVDTNTNGRTWVFINGNYVGNFLPNDGKESRPTYFAGWQIKDESKVNRQGAGIDVWYDSDRPGHTEYFDANGYTVTFEDVLNDAGLADAVDDNTIIMKSSNMQRYIPGGDTNTTVNESYQINRDVVYDANGVASIHKDANVVDIEDGDGNVTGQETQYTNAVRMLSSMYPEKGIGLGYAGYNPRYKYAKLSFDQEIETGGTWLEYGIANSLSSSSQAIQFWKNGDKLVAGVKGSGSNKTTNAAFTGKNHIDWILEPENGVGVHQHLYINGEFVSTGLVNTTSLVRTSDLVINTKYETDMKLSDFSITLYNDEKDFDTFDAEIKESYLASQGEKIYWLDDNVECGYERGYNAYEGQFAVYVTAKDTGLGGIPADTKFVTAIYNADGALLEAGYADYISGRTVADETEENIFSMHNKAAKTAKVYIWSNMEPQINTAKVIDLKW